MQYNNIFLQLISTNLPDAVARVKGGSRYPALNGIVKFYKTPFHGIIIEAELAGLPEGKNDAPAFLGFHIHEADGCSGDFSHSGSHFNPENMSHPYHLGDLPAVLNNSGYAYMMFYDDYLTISAIVGRSVIIHSQRDDFTTNPAGDSGTRIGCGAIRKY